MKYAEVPKCHNNVSRSETMLTSKSSFRRNDVKLPPALQFNTQRYRSGHNGADSKSVCAKAHEGSNPSLCANKKVSFVYQTKETFLNDVCLRQMMLATPMMFTS